MEGLVLLQTKTKHILKTLQHFYDILIILYLGVISAHGLSDSLAGEETLTGSSMYAGSPGPHLLQAVTLNRYSFPSTTSVTVNSRSWIPVTTCESEQRDRVLSEVVYYCVVMLTSALTSLKT